MPSTARSTGGIWLILAVVAVGVTVVATNDPVSTPVQEGSATRTDTQVPTPSLTRIPVPPARRAGALPAEDPVSARLPSGVVVPIVPVSSRDDGLLDVPADIATAGWWRGSSRIGDPFGSTLVAGHVDSRVQGLGPFAELLTVRPRSRIVLAGRSLRQTYRVRSLRLVPQGSLEDRRWIYSPAGPRRLTLVTCAGPYDASRGGYQNLVVVVATPTGAPTRSRS